MKLSDIHQLTVQLESLTTVLPYKKVVDTQHLVRYAFVFNEDVYVVDFDYQYASDMRFAVLTFYVVENNNDKQYSQTNKGKYAGPCYGTVRSY